MPIYHLTHVFNQGHKRGQFCLLRETKINDCLNGRLQLRFFDKQTSVVMMLVVVIMSVDDGRTMDPNKRGRDQTRPKNYID